MVRLLILLFTNRWGLIVVGALLAIGGLVSGIGSHTVAYQSVSMETVAHFLVPPSSSSSTIGYLQLQNDSNLYVINENDFTPSVSNSFRDGDVISFVYRTDQTTSVDETASNYNTHLQGNAYTIEQITVLGSNGQPTGTFATSEFTQNPNGFYQNNWPVGGELLVVGLIVGGLALGLPMLRGRNKKQPSFNAAMPASMGALPQANPYVQPYQGPAQYPQYPQQPNPYAAPYPPQRNPYGQPPQPGQPYPQHPPQPGSYDPTQRANPYDTPPQG